MNIVVLSLSAVVNVWVLVYQLQAIQTHFFWIPELLEVYGHSLCYEGEGVSRVPGFVGNQSGDPVLGGLGAVPHHVPFVGAVMTTLVVWVAKRVLSADRGFSGSPVVCGRAIGRMRGSASSRRDPWAQTADGRPGDRRRLGLRRP